MDLTAALFKWMGIGLALAALAGGRVWDGPEGSPLDSREEARREIFGSFLR